AHPAEAGSPVHLPADRRQLYAILPGDAQWRLGLDAVRHRLGTGDQRHAAGDQAALRGASAVASDLRGDGLARADRRRPAAAQPGRRGLRLAAGGWHRLHRRYRVLCVRHALPPLARHLAPVRGGWQLTALRGHRRVCGLRPGGWPTAFIVHRNRPPSPRGGPGKRRPPPRSAAPLPKRMRTPLARYFPLLSRRMLDAGAHLAPPFHHAEHLFMSILSQLRGLVACAGLALLAGPALAAAPSADLKAEP